MTDLPNATLSKYQLVDSTLKTLEAASRDCNYKTGEELLTELTQVGKKLLDRHRNEIVVLNVILRVFKLVQEEAQRMVRGQPDYEEDITNDLFLQPKDIMNQASGMDLKEAVMDAIVELSADLLNAEDNIASQAFEHIHSDELILTIGYSRTVEYFLKVAAKTRRFHAIIVKTEFHSAEPMALTLSQSGNCKVTVIGPASIFAVMARVNKVIIGPEVIFANGSFQATCGTYGTATAAKRYRVPVILCTPIYEFSPLWTYPPSEESGGNTTNFLPGWPDRKCAMVHNPQHDCVPADMVSIIVTNTGGFAPSFVYRLVNDHYKQEHLERFSEIIGNVGPCE